MKKISASDGFVLGAAISQKYPEAELPNQGFLDCGKVQARRFCSVGGNDQAFRLATGASRAGWADPLRAA